MLFFALDLIIQNSMGVLGLLLKRRKRMGELLIERGVSSLDDVNRGLDLARESGFRLGKSMVALDLITEEDIVDILSTQFGIEKCDVESLNIDSGLVGQFEDAYLRRHSFLPVKLDEDSISVIIHDPLNVVLLDELKRTYSKPVVCELVTESVLLKLISNFLDDSDSIVQDIVIVDEESNVDDGYNIETNVDSAPVVRLVSSFLREGVVTGASDIHISVNQRDMDIRYRIDGLLHEKKRLPKNLSSSVITRIKMMAGLDISERRLPQDGGMRTDLDGRVVDLRVSTLPSYYGEKVVIRILDKSESILRVDSLGFSDENKDKFLSLIKKPVGIFLVTGPTGSGKSSTLYASVNEINTRDKNIITIEDPVEMKVEGITQVSINNKIGLGFSEGLRSILRQDPDVILVGEIRDRETAEISISASNTGHLLLTTLHTNSAISALTRLVDMGIEDYLVASNVIGVLNQRLVRKVCNHCKETYRSGENFVEGEFFGLGEDTILCRGTGCSKCNYTGFKGRVPLQELLVMDDDLGRKLLSSKSVIELEEVAKKNGFKTLKMDGLDKALSGVTTLGEVMRYVT